MFQKTKSSKPDFSFVEPIVHKLDLLLSEQLHQRKDLSVLNALLKQAMNNSNLQRQVDEYFEDDRKNIPEDESDSNHGSS